MIEANYLEKNHFNYYDLDTRPQYDEIYNCGLGSKSFNENKAATKEFIKTFDLNDDYQVISSRANGDCFFHSISQASAIERDRGSGMKLLTIKRLRNEVSKFGNINYLKSLQEIYKSENEYVRTVHLNEYLANINLEQISDETVSELELEFRKWMKTHNYWADEFAINALEERYSIKILLFSTETNSFSCFGYDNGNDTISPELYFILNYQGRHYELVTFNGKAAFEFSDLPNKIKDIVVETCLSQNSVYNKIEGFKEILCSQTLNYNQLTSYNLKDYQGNAIKQQYKDLTNKEISQEDIERCINNDDYIYELVEMHLNEIETKKEDEKLKEVMRSHERNELVPMSNGKNPIILRIRNEYDFNLGYDFINRKISKDEYLQNVIKLLIKNGIVIKIVIGGSNLDKRFKDFDVVTGYDEVHRQLTKETYNENIMDGQYVNYFLKDPIQLNFDFNNCKQVSQLFNSSSQLKFSKIIFDFSTVKFLKPENVTKFIQNLFGSLSLGGRLFLPIKREVYLRINIVNNKIKFGEVELSKDTDFLINNNSTYTLQQRGYDKLKNNNLLNEILMPSYIIRNFKDNRSIQPNFSFWKNSAMVEILKMFEGSYQIVEEEYLFKSKYIENVSKDDYIVVKKKTK